MAEKDARFVMTAAMAREAVARGSTVRVEFRTGACWTRVIGFQPARGKRPARLLVDVTGVPVAVALGDVTAVATAPPGAAHGAQAGSRA